MTIERVNLNIPGNTNPLGFGLQITETEKFTTVHIFALSTSPNLREQLWAVKDIISERLDADRDCLWFLTNHKVTTALSFEYFEGRPLRIDISNSEALNSKAFSPSVTLDYYTTNPKPIDVKEHFRKAVRNPYSLFSLGVENRHDNILWCTPPHLNEKTESEYQFFLADTKKLISVLKDSEKAGLKENEISKLGMLQTKFNKLTPEQILSQPSFVHPAKTASLGLNKDRNIDLVSGNKEALFMAEKLKLPFLPVAVNLYPRSDRAKIRDGVGYEYIDSKIGLRLGSATEQIDTLTSKALNLV